MTAIYYNDFDAGACDWLTELAKEGLLPHGTIDRRSIGDIQAFDLWGYEQCHFFAGIGGWPEALRLAGWGTRPVWTGSCPCQPFSAAGKRKGTADARHLWPELFRLIRECRPPVIFGEQVASSEVVGTQQEAAFVDAIQRRDYAKANKLARRLAQTRGFHYFPRWVDGVQADLAKIDYAFWFAILGAHSVKSPHIRQRVCWVAYADQERKGREPGILGASSRSLEEQEPQSWRSTQAIIDGLPVGRLADAQCSQRRQDEQHQQLPGGREQATDGPGCGGGIGGMGNTQCRGLQGGDEPEGQPEAAGEGCGTGGLGNTSGTRLAGRASQPGDDGTKCEATERAGGDAFWSRYDLIPCRDGKLRRAPQGAQSIFLGLADGLPGGVDAVRRAGFPLCEKFTGRNGLLKGYGNAINVYVAAAFVRAFMQAVEMGAM